MVKSLLIVAALMLPCGLAEAGPITYFAFDSVPGSFVGMGLTDYRIAPEDGWTFSASRNPNNGVNFFISRPPTFPEPDSNWMLLLAAPFDAVLTPGTYDDATRFTSRSPDQPAIEFSGNGRGYNEAEGSFQILEAEYGPTGDVISFAVDFTYHGSTQPDNEIVGSLRFNATAVPEPVHTSFAAAAIVPLAVLRRRIRTAIARRRRGGCESRA